MRPWIIVTSLVLSLFAVPTAASPPDRPVLGKPHEITLITGDRITVRSTSSGYAVQATSGTFRQQRIGGRHYVIPIAAAGLVTSGVLDRQLFELDTLVRSGVDDASRSSWPLLLQYADRHAAARASRLGARTVRELPVVDSVAVEQPKSGLSRFWKQLTSSRAVRKVWFDAGIRPLLDRSTGQVGAPAAWKSGFTGKGVRVAVLDTGYDANHPDLRDAVVATKDFTTEDSRQQPLSDEEAPTAVEDEAGHGTHVASIVAGSNDRYPGVAPDADLLIGKVCAPFGCSMSWIIAGMEWAAASGAKVVNLSLGGGPSDGTDPLSHAVNEISARTGALFVVAAGNDGAFGAETVTSPAAADAALAVGSVTKSNTLSEFSSRGPRPGNSGLKPDITAPGDRIAAARASGTLQNEAISEQHAELSGTSMAAPHVAGAAALLAQQHPGWSAARLKAALMGSAAINRRLSVYDQGAGRLDVARAVAQPVIAEPANLDLGVVRWPHDDDPVVERTITYTNTSDTSITLSVQTDVDVVELDRRTVTVPARGSASVRAVVDTSDVGRHGGWVLARGKNVVVRTPVGIDNEAESHEQSFLLLDRNGTPAGNDPEGYPLGYLTLISRGRIHDVPLENGRGTVRIPSGDYLIDAGVITAEDGSVTLIADPRRTIGKPGTTVLDARAANPLTVDRPRPDAHAAATLFGFVKDGYYGAIANASAPDEPPRRLFAVPTSVLPGFTAVLTAFWAKPSPEPRGTWYENSPYLYNQIVPFRGRIPADLHVPSGEFTEVPTRYAVDRDGKYALNWPFPWLDGTPIFAYVPAVGMALPFERREFYSKAGSWSFMFEVYAEEFYEELDAQARAPKGPRDRWNGAVFGPGLPDPEVGPPPWPPTLARSPWAYRDGDSMRVAVPLFSDGVPDRAGRSTMTGQTTALFRDGQLLRRTDAPYQQVFRVPATPATYRLETTATRDFGVSTTVRSVWSFRSSHTRPGSKVALPLLAVRFSPELDLSNRAPGGVTYRIPVTVQPSGKLRSVEVSYDDGRSWQPAAVHGSTVSVTHPDRGWVSLRARATGRKGNSVEQTIIRAYELNTK